MLRGGRDRSLLPLLLLLPLLRAAGATGGGGGSARPPGSSYRACDCWTLAAAEGGAGEVQCRCAGSGPIVTPGVHSLALSEPRVQRLRANALAQYADSLRDLVLTNARVLHSVEEDCFRRLPHLRSVSISEAPALQRLPDDLLDGVGERFRTLRVVRTGLREVPRLQGLPRHAVLHMIDLESNRIHTLRPNAMQVKAELVILNYNSIEAIEGWAFNGSEIATLSLKGNRALSRLAEDAFSGLHSLRDLDLSATAISRLPTRGLAALEVLRLRDTAALITIPSVYNFKHLREAWLTYSFHCCAFSYPARHDPARHALHQAYEEELRRRCRANASSTARAGIGEEEGEGGQGAGGPRRRRQPAGPSSRESGDESEGEGEGEGEGEIEDSLEHWHDAPEPGGARSRAHGHDEESEWVEPPGVFHPTTAVPRRRLHAVCGNMSTRVAVRCRPAPDALNPCEDIMGWSWLRACVWLVLSTAVLGNGAVLAVLLAAPSHFTPAKFLMCNLAFADLCMGVYLLLLAAADAHSHGSYFNFAYRWQKGAGCRAAGFLTVFASQLSVYTLAVLTLERWVAITYALHLNKRLKLRAAAYIMAAGWLYALAMAALPLAGVSNYATTSICLPMDTSEAHDVAYLVSLLVTNALAFALVCVCYLQIYLSLGRDTRRSGRGGAAAGQRRRGELTVAKRMALLVFTDFACWAPIAFFGLTAVSGYPLIDVTRSKILLVFFYPLNSCANPYLYALLTKQYRRDLLTLLARYRLCTRAAQQHKGGYSLPTTNQSQPQHVLVRVAETTATGAVSGAGAEEAAV